MISIIVANYNKKELLKNCLDSLKNQTFQDMETIVVDNASTDGSSNLVKKLFPEVKLILNDKNFLFSKAYNQGIDISKGEFILC